MGSHVLLKAIDDGGCVHPSEVQQVCIPQAISVPTSSGLPALASIKCSDDAYAVLESMAGLGLMAVGPTFVQGPYEAAVRRLAGEFDGGIGGDAAGLQQQLQQRPQQLPPQQRRRKPKKK